MTTQGPRTGATVYLPPSDSAGRRPSTHNPLRRPPEDAPHSVYPLARRERPTGFLRRLSTSGLTLGLVLLWVALSPSLLPRAWWVTAVNVGVSMTFGYAVGVLLGRLASWVSRRTDLRVELNARSDWAMRTSWIALLVIVSAVVWIRSLQQQEGIALLVGVTYGGALHQFAGVVAGILLFLLILLLGRGLARTRRAVRRAVRRVLPGYLAPVAATLIVALLVLFVTNEVLFDRGMNAALRAATQLNQQTPEGRVAPTEPERSGSPASNESWEHLGNQGMKFVSDGPRAADIEAVTGEPAMEPIRVYAGRTDHDSVQEAAQAAVAELVRAGGLDRSLVLVTTTTGTGWVQPFSAEAVEYLTGGDVATVSMQYSFFPSGLAYISDLDTPPLAGRTLFEEVEALIQKMPEDERPLLYVSGESLGSYGSQGAFADADELLERVDGAVWTGTPRFTPLWSDLTANRRQGSPEIAPVIDNGRHIRFATQPEELVHDFYGGPLLEWESPRIVYAQHASDPVVWWSWDLLWKEPDWLREKVGRDVSPDLSYTPYVTFWQIAADMPLSLEVEPGHGHEYQAQMVAYWAGALGMDPLGDYSRIEAAINASVSEDD